MKKILSNFQKLVIAFSTILIIITSCQKSELKNNTLTDKKKSDSEISGKLTNPANFYYPKDSFITIDSKQPSFGKTNSLQGDCDFYVPAIEVIYKGFNDLGECNGLRNIEINFVYHAPGGLFPDLM